MRFLYQEQAYRDQIFSFVMSRDGSREDAEDVFQDGIRSLIFNVREGKYQGQGSVKGYLFGICRNLWFKRFQKIQRQDSQLYRKEGLEVDRNDPEIILLEKDQEEQLNHLLNLLGENCRKVLELWKLSYSMKEIAAEVGYKNEAVARKKKRLCLKKLLDIMEEQPQWKTWLK